MLAAITFRSFYLLLGGGPKRPGRPSGLSLVAFSERALLSGAAPMMPLDGIHVRPHLARHRGEVELHPHAENSGMFVPAAIQLLKGLGGGDDRRGLGRAGYSHSEG